MSVTVVVRSVPGLSVRCGTWVARLARTAFAGTWLQRLQLSVGRVPFTTTGCLLGKNPKGSRWVFDQLQAVLLDELGEAGGIELERVSVDSFSLRAVKGRI